MPIITKFLEFTCDACGTVFCIPIDLAQYGEDTELIILEPNNVETHSVYDWRNTGETNPKRIREFFCSSECLTTKWGSCKCCGDLCKINEGTTARDNLTLTQVFICDVCMEDEDFEWRDDYSASEVIALEKAYSAREDA